MVGICLPMYYTLYHPGYTHPMSCTPSTSALATSLPDDEALGSREEKGLGGSLSVPQSPKGVRFGRELCADSSALPEDKCVKIG